MQKGWLRWNIKGAVINKYTLYITGLGALKQLCQSQRSITTTAQQTEKASSGNQIII